MEPNCKAGACDADMGNEPAGHWHAQLQPPFAAAWAAPSGELLLPEPAITVTAGMAAVAFEEDPVATALAAPVPATTVTGAAAAAPPPIPPVDALLFPAPATTVTGAAAAAPPDGLGCEARLELTVPPSPAMRVTAAAVPLLDTEPGEAFPALVPLFTAAGAPVICAGGFVQEIGVTAGKADFPAGSTVWTGLEDPDDDEDASLTAALASDAVAWGARPGDEDASLTAALASDAVAWGARPGDEDASLTAALASDAVA